MGAGRESFFEIGSDCNMQFAGGLTGGSGG